MSTANNSKTRAAKQASMAGEVQLAKKAGPTATQVTGQEKSKTKCEELNEAVQDTAERDRRQNLRLVGLKEKLEDGKLAECVRKIITEALGIELDQAQLQRIHRSRAPMPDESCPPRPIIICFFSNLEWERVLAAARGKYRSGQSIVCGGLQAVFLPRYDKRVGREKAEVYGGEEKVACPGCTFHPGIPSRAALHLEEKTD